MSSRRILVATFAILAALAWSGAAQAQGAGTAAPTDPWPRPITLGTATGLVYQPQVNSWQDNMLDFRAAVAVKPTGAVEETFGVVTGSAWTQVDRVTHKVTLEFVTLTKVLFPTLPNDGAAYTQALEAQLRIVLRTIALDRLETSLAASGTVKPAGIPVNNTPPRILVSYTPALLVPIDGAPVLRPVSGTQFERVINTQALILQPQGSTTFYLHVYNGWLYAGTLQGPWFQPFVLPPKIDQVAQTLARAGLVDLIDGGKTKPNPSLAKGVPTIYVSETPTELIVFKGQPAFTAIPGTTLTWASNTANDVVFDTATKEYYVLLSGRWFQSAALTGLWTYVTSTSLPADFHKIPGDSPAGIVLASVAGTPQAQEAVIANSIPQTATIPRVNGPKFAPVIDGSPQLHPIEGTPLEYVFNSPTPIIEVDPAMYYALQGGVWFYAISLKGPWYVAPSVPTVIYSIPATSPLHYVTYVHVYGSTAQVVYVGYTPGYLGTVVTPDGVVVYGTGYTYPTYVGTAWYPPPATYGVMAQPVYNPAVGMTFGFAMGVLTAGAMYDWGATPYYHPAYYGYPCCGSASANVYGQWGRTAYSGTRSWYDNPGGSYGTTASGTYHNYATGTSGSYAAGRSYNPYTGQEAAGYGRTFNTTSGVSGGVERGATYNPQTGTATTGAAGTATVPGGRTTSAEGTRSANVYGQQAAQAEHTTTNPNTGITRTGETIAAASPGGTGAEHQTTVTNTQTGQSKTYSSAVGHEGNTAYADHDGNVYKNSGSGWQQHTSSGWQSASADSSWADKEQQARSQGEDDFNSFRQSGGGSGSSWASRDGGGGGWGHFGGGGGGWGDRFGGGGGSWASRFGGGGGGWGGGRFGGFRR
jgi:hypothetical protein